MLTREIGNGNGLSGDESSTKGNEDNRGTHFESCERGGVRRLDVRG